MNTSMAIQRIRIGVTWTILITVLLFGRAQGTDASETGSRTQPKLESYVRADGSVDLEALRQAGIEGSIDLSGQRVSFDRSQGALIATPQAGPTPRATGDENWWDGFGSPGVTGGINSMAVFNDALVVAGEFTAAGGALVNNIARWDGAGWSGLDSGLNGTVNCLHVHDGKLVVGGWFSQAGGVDAARIAQWDGAAWAPIGAGFDHFVWALTSYKGELIAGGEFTHSGELTVDHIARWDGSTWQPLGGGADQMVGALGVFGGMMIAGGDFTSVGGLPIARIARWDGTTWNEMGDWPWWPRAVSFQEYQTQLYCRCWDLVLRWDGDEWFNTGYPGWGGGGSMCIFGGRLIACGNGANRVYAWDGTTWTSLDPEQGADGGHVVAVFGGNLYVGGCFFRAGSVNVLNIAAWDGTAWSGVGFSTNQGIGGTVHALAAYQGDVIAAGSFAVAGGVPVNNIARWDGDSWHPLAEGITGWENTVNCLLVHDDVLIVGGVFNYAGTLWSPGIARWDGSAWASFSSGVEGGLVRALIEQDGDLIAAGSFSRIGGVEANHVARWDGIQWCPLGSGIADCEIRALGVHGQDLIAGGCFSEAGGAPGNHVARWDGSSWSPLGTGLPGDVWALVSYNGSLVAGGGFDLGGGFWNLARWDGISWGPLGGSFDGDVRALAVIDGDLYAGGAFGGIGGGPPASRIARYDGYAWNVLGSGVERAVYAVTAADDPAGAHLYLGGELTRAGDGLLSAGIARWYLGATTARPNLLSVTDVGNDQGRQVRLRFRRSKFDAPGQPVTITGYAVFREQTGGRAEPPQTPAVLTESDAPTGGLRLERWDYITTVPAFGDTTYQCIAPTLCDSTASGGVCLSTFLIRAVTPSPFEYYDSWPLSGYSIDNLAPSVPGNLRFPDPTILAWDDVEVPDLDFYTVYQSSSSVFDPQTALLVGYTTETQLSVNGVHLPYLHVTATDFAGNEGHAGTILRETMGVAVASDLPERFALHPCRPNPTSGSAIIGFDLPAESGVTLRVFDVTGRELITVARGLYARGTHHVAWPGRAADGSALPAGMYFYRMDAGSFTETRKVYLLPRVNTPEPRR